MTFRADDYGLTERDYVDPVCACGEPVDEHGLACDDCSLIFPGRSEMTSPSGVAGERGASGESAPWRHDDPLGGTACSGAGGLSCAEFIEPSVRRRYVELAKTDRATPETSAVTANRDGGLE